MHTATQCTLFYPTTLTFQIPTTLPIIERLICNLRGVRIDLIRDYLYLVGSRTCLPRRDFLEMASSSCRDGPGMAGGD
jgi:hypothetical protein